MKFGLLTTKHHEGFCLWDSQYTEHDVAATPYKKDIVKQYAEAKMKKVFFPKSTARYVQFKVLDANGKNAIIAQIETGAFSAQPNTVSGE